MNPKSKRFSDRIKKMHRLLSILRKIDNRERCTPETLADEFDTTHRSIFRDISELNSSGFAIVEFQRKSPYSFKIIPQIVSE